MNELFSFEVPFNADLSKNRRYISFGGGQHFKKVLRKEHRNARTEVYWACVSAMKKAGYTKLWKTKIKIDLVIYKPSNKCDAQNFVDDFFDALEPAFKVNDNMFCGSFNWIIDKEKPRIHCTVSVNSMEPQIACKKCLNPKLKRLPCDICGYGHGGKKFNPAP